MEYSCVFLLMNIYISIFSGNSPKRPATRVKTLWDRNTNWDRCTKWDRNTKVGQMHKMSGFLLLIKNSFLAKKVLFMGNIAQKMSINLGMVWGKVQKKFEQNCCTGS